MRRNCQGDVYGHDLQAALGLAAFGNYIFAIFLVLTTIVSPYSLSYLSSEVTPEAWKLVTDPKSKLYLASFESFYYLLLSATVVFPIVAVLLLVTLCLKSRLFLRWVLIYLVAEFVYFVAQGWFILRLVVELKEKNIPQLAKAADQIQLFPYVSLVCILITFIWFRYFTTSKRARSVFE